MWRSIATIILGQGKIAGSGASGREDPEACFPVVNAIADPSLRDTARKLAKAAPADACWGFVAYPRIRWLAMPGENDNALTAP